MSRLIKIVLIFLILAMAAGGTYLYLQTQEPGGPGDVDVASEQVTNADMLKTQAQRDEFAQKWETFAADINKTVWNYIDYAQGEGARYQCDTVIMDKVGTETIYGCDLNVVFVIHNFPRYTSADPIGPQDPELNAVLDELITQSGMLQKAAELDILKLDDTFFNTPTKDYNKRFEMTTLARDEIGDQFVKRIDFEAVAIYFHNQIPPNIPLEEAKAAAKAKMDILYDRINSGEITMYEAGQEIINDNITGDTTGVKMEDLDRMWDTNAYLQITGHVFDNDIFIDPVYDEELRSLGEGQISTVRVFRDFSIPEDKPELWLEAGSDNAPFIESGYLIFKLNKIDFGLGEEFSQGNLEGIDNEIKNEFKEGAEIKL